MMPVRFICLLLIVFSISENSLAYKPKIDLEIVPQIIPLEDNQTHFVFDLPVAYNSQVKKWIHFFQTRGRKWFKKWLERSTKYRPVLEKILTEHQLPKDLIYLSMIESGFSMKAVSKASAVGPWQFMKGTANQYGLRTAFWIDERKDLYKSTLAASKYLKKLYKQFDSWYLAAAAYNSGENRIERIIKKYKTRDFWELSQTPGLFNETKNYIPKLIAAMLIAKAPHLYGFKNINYQKPQKLKRIYVKGGTSIDFVAKKLKLSPQTVAALNPDLLVNRIPYYIKKHSIKIPDEF